MGLVYTRWIDVLSNLCLSQIAKFFRGQPEWLSPNSAQQILTRLIKEKTRKNSMEKPKEKGSPEGLKERTEKINKGFDKLFRYL